MRLVYLSSSTLPSNRANSVHVMEMCAAFAGHGHDVTLVGRRGPGDDAAVFDEYGIERGAFRLVRLPRRGVASTVSALSAIRSTLRALDPDVVYGRDRYGVLLASRLDRAVVFEAHAPPGAGSSGWRAAVHRRIERSIVGSPNLLRLVLISEGLERDYRAALRLGPDVEVVVAHDGARAPAAVAPEPDDATLRVGYAGHLYAGRGIELLLDVARRLPDVELHLFGGTDEDLARWRAEAQPLANVHFAGHVPHASVPDRLASMHVLVAPYQRSVAVAGGGGDTARWMSPLKIFEYMAAGRAMVASDLPALREVLDPDRTALLRPADDVEGWVDAIESLRDRSRRRSIADAAAADLRERFSWAVRAERVLSGR